MSGKSGMSVDDGASRTVLQSSMWSTKDRQIGGFLEVFKCRTHRTDVKSLTSYRPSMPSLSKSHL